jgi:uncharacterized membrane protein
MRARTFSNVFWYTSKAMPRTLFLHCRMAQIFVTAYVYLIAWRKICVNNIDKYAFFFSLSCHVFKHWIVLVHLQNCVIISVCMIICLSVSSSLTTASSSSTSAASSTTSPLTSSSSDGLPARPRQSHKSRLLQFSSNRGFVYVLTGIQNLHIRVNKFYIFEQ